MIDGNPKLRLICFSLWGSDPLYNQGAIENLQLAPEVYPGWRCRFYCDPDAPAFSLLRRSDCDLIPMRALAWSGLFWRFLAAADPKVQCCIFRDCDSRLNFREARAVNAWLSSGKLLHTMHDHIEHLCVPILGGMWGIQGNQLHDLPSLIERWIGNAPVAWRGPDQEFLREVIWRRFATSHIGHSRREFVDGLNHQYGVATFESFSDCMADSRVSFVGEIVSPIVNRTTTGVE